MPAATDCSIAWAKEPTFGTFVTPTRSAEYTSESLQWEKTVNQGRGMRVGSLVDRSTRRAVTGGMGSGDLEMLLPARGLGLLWEALLGSSASTLVSGSTYQQWHRLVGAQGQLSVQKGIYRAGANVIDPLSFSGVTVKGVEIDSPNGEDIKVKWTLDIRDVSTVVAYTDVVSLYPSSISDEVFGFRHAALSVGGTLTAPTATDLASSSGAVSSCLRSFNLKIERDYSAGGFCYGQGGRKSKPTSKGVNISGAFTALYDNTTYRDAFLADTAMPVLFTLTGDQSLSTGKTGYQFALPDVRLEGELPNANDGDEIVVSHSFKGLHLESTEPLFVTCRTADTAL